MVKDPVCGIDLDNKSPCKSTYAGQVHVFCCASCQTTFDEDPGRYGFIAEVAPVGLRLPSAPSTSSFFLIMSPIGRLFQAILPKSMSDGAQGRSTWLFARTHLSDGR